MEACKILTAPVIDIIFDGRNKDYGAYELRKSDWKRTSTALIITMILVALAFGAALASGSKKRTLVRKDPPGVILTRIEEKKIVEPTPEPEKKPEQQVRTEKFTQLVVVDKEVIEPPPAIADLDSAAIGIADKEGKPDMGTVDAPEIVNTGSGLTPDKRDPEPEIYTTVEVEASFSGNWKNFLLKNLNANVPFDHGAPAGTYSVVVQFVVDTEGQVSDVKALTAHGYGLEEEAVRVIRKSVKWEPAIQNGYKVKAYRRQMITFQGRRNR